MRLPAYANLHINAFSGGAITDLESGMLNGVVVKSGSGDYITQRPSVDVFEDASVTVADAKGRGIYRWDSAPGTYFVNANKIYKNTYATVIGTITTGTQKCYFFEVGTLLVLLDPQNNQGWTITVGGVLAEITDLDFPPKQTPARGIAFGGAVLDGYLFVLAEDGTIYNSSLKDAVTWNALSFVDAERQTDGGVYLGIHHDNLVVFGARSIEFFYDAQGASPASPLARRQDVYHAIGCASGESVYQDGDVIYFVGNDSSGSLGVYRMASFAIEKISTPTMDAFLTKSVVSDGYSILGSGLSGEGSTQYILTMYLLSGTVQSLVSLSYNSVSGLWSEYRTAVSGHTHFSLVAWTTRSGINPRIGEGIFSNGDLFTVIDNLSPVDTIGGTGWVAAGWVAAGWVVAAAAAGANGVNIQMKTRLGQFDGGTTIKKKAANLSAVIDKTVNASTLTVRWSDENGKAFNQGREINTAVYEKINATGSFRRRNFELEAAGNERLKLYALEGDIVAGFK